MQMKKYEQYLHNGFSYSELRQLLGEEITESLLEWPEWPDNPSRETLIQMVFIVHGYRLFQNKDFRQSLLNVSPREELLELFDDRKKQNHYLNNTTKEAMAKELANKAWGDNDFTKQLISFWELPDNVIQAKPVDTMMSTTVKPATEKRFYELLDYQYSIKQRVISILNSQFPQERMIVHMPTGTGKTKTAMHIIAHHYCFDLKEKGLVIWLAHTKELLNQAYETFCDVWSHLGADEINVYKVFGGSKVTFELDNGIAFVGTQKLLSMFSKQPDKVEQIKRNVRLIVFDEAHIAAAAETKKIVDSLMLTPQGYPDRSLIGLTATPGRSTTLSFDNVALTNLFGGKYVSIDTKLLNEMNNGQLEALNRTAETNIIKYFQQRGVLAKMNAELLSYQKDFSDEELKTIEKMNTRRFKPGGDYSNKEIEIFAKNKNRNAAIIQKLDELNITHTPTIVFACSVNHAKLLAAFLSLKGVANSLVHSDLTDYERQTAIELFKDKNSGVDIIINYGVLSTGFDSTNIKCVMITRPTKSVVLYSQMLGRGLRGPMMGGNENCLLVDVEDNLETFDNEKAFSHFDAYWKD